MPTRPGDHDPDPPGGRAAERRREFEQARGLAPEEMTPLDEELTSEEDADAAEGEGEVPAPEILAAEEQDAEPLAGQDTCSESDPEQANDEEE
ncbi:MAG TPA: hypothetical protein VFP08_02420 [Acidimicrobiales bacterium]|nr:hypothetical protein [Acidimicrobiales bacterium]